tara:strand:+ start:340 stop:573 length:234 start_codon:yes stop_codon:yes gene_type:complete
MIIEVKRWPESQEVMDKPDWFFIMDGNPNSGSPIYTPSKLGDSAYGRILDESEYILVELTTADKYNKEWLNEKETKS